MQLTPPRQGYREDLNLALVIADAVDALTMSRFQAVDLQVDTKPDMTPVSDADRAAEELIRRQLKRARPRDAVTGEEFGTDGNSKRRWTIDPIDGTKNFVRGVPRSEEHTSELQSRGHIVCRILLEINNFYLYQ